MRFVDWFFEIGEFDNPYYPGQWKFLHINFNYMRGFNY